MGATGLVGRQILMLALADDRIASVCAPTRRPLAIHPKLLNPIVDFAALPNADWWQADAVLGADPDSANFYLKVKGQIEKDLPALEFDSLTLVRPSLLDGGPRPQRRYGEEIGLWVGTRLNALIPKRYRPVSTQAVAQAMLEAALQPKPGIHIIESEDLPHSIGKS